MLAVICLLRWRLNETAPSDPGRLYRLPSISSTARGKISPTAEFLTRNYAFNYRAERTTRLKSCDEAQRFEKPERKTELLLRPISTAGSGTGVPPVGIDGPHRLRLC